jgi:hypothetical protein
MGHRFVAARQIAKHVARPCGNVKKAPILADI